MIWRLGTVPYLNAEPLTAALREQDAALLVGDPTQLRALVPSRLLETLRAGELDAALVSVGGVLAHPELRMVPGIGVVSRGPVRSIQLYCRVPIRQVRRVALDASSRSAVLLARLLLTERWGLRPEFVTLPPDLPAMLAEADAALLIGNPALCANHALATGRYWKLRLEEQYDLGEEWDRLTGLPFVYAVWALPEHLRAGVPTDGWEPLEERLARLLDRARQWGCRRIGMLARRGAAELGIPEPAALEYLTGAIHYEVGPREVRGMETFREMAVEHGLLPPASRVALAA